MTRLIIKCLHIESVRCSHKSFYARISDNKAIFVITLHLQLKNSNSKIVGEDQSPDWASFCYCRSYWILRSSSALAGHGRQSFALRVPPRSLAPGFLPSAWRIAPVPEMKTPDWGDANSGSATERSLAKCWTGDPALWQVHLKQVTIFSKSDFTFNKSIVWQRDDSV